MPMLTSLCKGSNAQDRGNEQAQDVRLQDAQCSSKTDRGPTAQVIRLASDSTVHPHRECFARWWRWEQRSLHAKRKQALEDLGARAGPVLSEQGLTPDAKGLYAIRCPSCR